MLRNAFDDATSIPQRSSTANPAAGAEATIIALASAQWELLHMSFLLVTDANVADRIVTISLETGGVSVLLGSSAFAHTASKTFQYICHQNAQLNTVASIGTLFIALPNLRNTDKTATLKINIANIQAADQLSLILTTRRLWGF